MDVPGRTNVAAHWIIFRDAMLCIASQDDGLPDNVARHPELAAERLAQSTPMTAGGAML